MGSPVTINFQTAAPIGTRTCHVLAEAGQCMEGSLGRALEMVADAAMAGAWGIKVQLLRPETIATPNAPKYWDDDLGSTTQREAFTMAGLIDYDRWGPIRNAARTCNMAFVATPFDLEAVDALERLSLDAYKVASGDLLWTPLLDAIVDTGRPLILSTGAAWEDEITDTMARLIRRDPTITHRMVILACDLVYPTPEGKQNLGRITRLYQLAAEYGWTGIHIGYSDHTLSPTTAYDAAVCGASILEKHYTYKGASGPVADHGMAVDPEGLARTVLEAQRGARTHGEARIVPSEAEERARHGARRAMYLVRPVATGEPARLDDAVALRPCPYDAMPPDVWYEVVPGGVTYRTDRAAGDMVRASDLSL